MHLGRGSLLVRLDLLFPNLEEKLIIVQCKAVLEGRIHTVYSSTHLQSVCISKMLFSYLCRAVSMYLRPDLLAGPSVFGRQIPCITCFWANSFREIW